MAVDAPRQNQHRWWGTLTIDAATTISGNIPKYPNGDYWLCVFVKTTRDAHFVSAGTHIGGVSVFANLQAAKDRIDTLDGLDEKDRKAIKADLDDIDWVFRECPIVEVTNFGYANSSPLGEELRAKTKTLLENAAWREDHKERINKDSVERGLKLKP